MANPRGQQRDKPFRDALRMEIAAAGEDLKALRKVAQALIAKAGEGDVAAIRELGDRLDGKPMQSVEVGKPGDFEQMSDDELEAFIAGRENRTGRSSGGNGKAPDQKGMRGKPIGVH